MTDYETLKQRLENIRLEILKDKITGGVDLKRKLLSDGRTKVIAILQQINDAIDISVRKLIASYGLDAKYLNAAPDLGFKQISYDFNDSTMSLQGLDGNYYDVPSFPQMKITDEDRQAMLSNMKQLSEEVAKRRVVLRCNASDAGSVGDPDAEDALYAYYYAEAVGYYELHDVNYESVLGISPIVFDAPTYFAIDMEIPRRLRLLKVTAYSFAYSWFGGDVVIGLDINPTLTVCDPDDDTKKRVTTGAYVVNALNHKSVKFELLVDTYVIPVKANTHTLILLGGELTGISGTLVMAEKSV